MEKKNRHFILGTAGHIDHGKTALVKALTGVDTDRLKEEKARGLTIDLGFAHMGDNATIIDVPGHEKFIKNMVAGVSTIDLVLFVVAADDGVMPQTREHLDILNILQVRDGIIVITKKDLVDDEWLQLVREDIRVLVKGTNLEKAEIVAVSALTGEGIPGLKAKIESHLASLPPRPNRGLFWLPVDRSFSMRGFGTVVTGSVLSGQLRTGEIVEILPRGLKARVRGLQKHNRPTELVQVGDRAAVNLQGISREQVTRGDVLSTPGYFRSTTRMHGKLRLLAGAPTLKPNTRIRLHVGTAEYMARVKPIGIAEVNGGETAYVQLNLEAPAAARRLDPFVIRQYSPPRTIAGGVVLDANAPPYHRRDRQLVDRLRGLEQEDPEELLCAQFFNAVNGLVSADELVSKTGLSAEAVRERLKAMQDNGKVIAVSKKQMVHKSRLESLEAQILAELQRFHERQPTAPGARKAEFAHKFSLQAAPPLVSFALERLKTAGRVKEFDGFVALSSHEITLPAGLRRAKQHLEQRLLEQGYTPDTPAELAAALKLELSDVETLLDVLQVEHRILRLQEGIFIHSERVEQARRKLIAYLRQHNQITVPAFKELIGGASRKFALPLLNYFDAEEITLREGDVRYAGAALRP